MNTKQKAMIERIVQEDVQGLIKSEVSYGDSWKKRGGVGSYMMLARKWDRIEKQCKDSDWDILGLGLTEKNAGIDDGILDDIRDLRAYLLLVEAEIRLKHMSFEELCSLGKTSTPEKEAEAAKQEDNLYADHDTGSDTALTLQQKLLNKTQGCDDDCGEGEAGPGYVNQD